jgi:hypothetical protein
VQEFIELCKRLIIALDRSDEANAKLDMILARLSIIETIGARSKVLPAGEHSLEPPPGALPLAPVEVLQAAYAASLVGAAVLEPAKPIGTLPYSKRDAARVLATLRADRATRTDVPEGDSRTRATRLANPTSAPRGPLTVVLCSQCDTATTLAAWNAHKCATDPPNRNCPAGKEMNYVF